MHSANAGDRAKTKHYQVDAELNDEPAFRPQHNAKSIHTILFTATKQLYPYAMPSFAPLKPINKGKPLDRMRRAAGQLVLEHGIDSVSVSAVIQASDVSRRTFYSYYESVPAVLADIWINFGSEWLGRLSDSSKPIEQAVTDFDALLIYCMAIAHRVDELHELIIEDVDQLWHRLDRQPMEQLRWIWLVGVRVGFELHRMSGVSPSGPQLMQLLEMIRTADLAALTENNEIEPPRYPTLKIVDADEVTERVLNATVDVVGKSGAIKTNVLRVCRKAKVSAGAIAGRFPTPERFVSAAFERILGLVLEQNLIAYPEFEGVSLDYRYSASIRSGLLPSRARWRKFRREIVIASCHNSAIRDQALASLKVADLPLRSYLAGTSFPESAQVAATNFNRELSEGFSILLDLGVPVDKVGHLAPTRVAVKWLTTIP